MKKGEDFNFFEELMKIANHEPKKKGVEQKSINEIDRILKMYGSKKG